MSRNIFLATTGQGIARAEALDSGGWQVTSPVAGRAVYCLARDPLHHHTVFAGSQGGLLRSDDAGRTWRSSGLDGRIVKAVAASPTRPGVVFAGVKPAALFQSEDGGATWRELASFRRIRGRRLWFSPAEPPFIGYVQAIAPSPTDPSRVAVGIEFGATVLSVDGGQTWTGHRPGSLRDCHSLTGHALRGEWLYEGGGTGGGHAFSRDGGETWSRTQAGLDCHYGWAVAADPARPEVWYLSAAPGASKAHSANNAQAGIFRHDGAQWRRLTGGLPQPLNHMPYALITDPAQPGHVYAGLSNGDIWHSTDHGEQWRQLPVNLGSVHRAMIRL